MTRFSEFHCGATACLLRAVRSLRLPRLIPQLGSYFQYLPAAVWCFVQQRVAPAAWLRALTQVPPQRAERRARRRERELKGLCATRGADEPPQARCPAWGSSLGTGTCRSGPFVLLRFSCQNKRVLRSSKKTQNSGEAPVRHNSPQSGVWFFLTCPGCGGLGPRSPSPPPFYLAGGTRRGELAMSFRLLLGKVTFPPAPHNLKPDSLQRRLRETSPPAQPAGSAPCEEQVIRLRFLLQIPQRKDLDQMLPRSTDSFFLGASVNGCITNSLKLQVHCENRCWVSPTGKEH